MALANFCQISSISWSGAYYRPERHVNSTRRISANGHLIPYPNLDVLSNCSHSEEVSESPNTEQAARSPLVLVSSFSSTSRLRGFYHCSEAHHLGLAPQPIITPSQQGRHLGSLIACCTSRRIPEAAEVRVVCRRMTRRVVLSFASMPPLICTSWPTVVNQLVSGCQNTTVLPKNNRSYMQFVVDKDLRETLYTN